MQTIIYKNNNVLQDVCRKLENSRKRYGRLYKFEIPIHTLASSDYQIHEIKDNGKRTYYKDYSVEEILKYALEKEMITHLLALYLHKLNNKHIQYQLDVFVI